MRCPLNNLDNLHLAIPESSKSWNITRPQRNCHNRLVRFWQKNRLLETPACLEIGVKISEGYQKQRAPWRHDGSPQNSSRRHTSRFLSVALGGRLAWPASWLESEVNQEPGVNENALKKEGEFEAIPYAAGLAIVNSGLFLSAGRSRCPHFRVWEPYYNNIQPRVMLPTIFRAQGAFN